MTFSESQVDDLLPEIARLLDTGSSTGSEPISISSVLDDLRNELVDRLELMLEHRRELLMSLLYRVDVKEALVVEAFKNLTPEELAPRLADLIIERQIQKVHSRRVYRDRNI